MRFTTARRRRLLIVGTLYFTFLGGTFITDHTFWPRVAHHAIVTGLLIIWLVGHLRRRQSLPSTALDAPLLALFLAGGLATAFAVDPRISVEFLWRTGFHTLLFYMVTDLFVAGYQRDVFEALFFTSAVVIVIGIVEFASWYFGLAFIPAFRQGWPAIAGLTNPIPPFIYRLQFTLSVTTGLSAYFAMLIPLGLAFALTGRTADTRRAFWLWLAGALLIEGLTFSRGGVLALAVSLPTFAVLALLSGADVRQRVKRLFADRRIVWGAGAALIVLILIGLGWATQNFGGHRTGDAVRRDLWRSALDIFRDHPLTGVGPYGYGRALRLVRNPLLARDQMVSPHNQALSTMAEVGIPGLVALLSLAASFLWAGYRRWQSTSGPERLRIAGIIAGLTGYAAQNMVDTFAATPIMLPLLVMAAFVVHRKQRPTHKSQQRVALSLTPLLLVVLLSGVGWAISDTAQFYFQRSLRLASAGDLRDALAQVERAESIDPSLELYAFQRAYLLGRLADEQPELLDDAIAAYQEVLASEPSGDIHRANLSALLAQSGDLPAAQAQMTAAQDMLPREARYTFWQGNYADALQDYDSAADFYSQALQTNLAWSASPYWQASQWRAAFLEERTSNALDNGDVQILLASGDVQAALAIARQQAAARPDDINAQAALGTAALRAGDIDTALTAFDAALARNSDSAQLYALRAEAWLARGDAISAEHAERDARMALFLDSSGADGKRGNYVLAQLAERAGDLAAAEIGYILAGPSVVSSQNWEVAVYGRKAAFEYLPQLELPGPGLYAFDPWLKLAHLYEEQGRDEDAENVYNAIRIQDPFFIE